MGEFFKPWRQKDRRGDAGDCVRVYGGMDSKLYRSLLVDCDPADLNLGVFDTY